MMESVLLLYNVALLLSLVWRHKFEPVVRNGDCRWRDTYKEAGEVQYFHCASTKLLLCDCPSDILLYRRST